MARKTTKQKNKELEKQGLKLRHFGMRFEAKPNEKQQQVMHQTFGNARFVRNMFLNEKNQQYKYDKTNLTSAAFKKFLNQLKKCESLKWLCSSDKFALETAIESVDDAFNRFFKGQNNYPTFKSKRESKQSYTTKETNKNIDINLETNTIKLPKLKNVNVFISKKQRESLKQSKAKIKTATVTFFTNGKYFVSLKFEEIVSIQTKKDVSFISYDEVIGLDLGLTHFYIDSNGKKVANHTFLASKLKKLKRAQKRLSRMIKGSNNYKKQQKRVAKIHLQIKNTRHDFLHKESKKIVDENQVIVLEDLNVKGMIKNKKLARSIQDVSWGLFKTFVTYKADWNNKHVVFVDRFYPSSKLCSGCHEKNTLLSLSDRVWVCPNCGTKHDRDVNAAENIKKEGMRILGVKHTVSV